jgi:hypothetical protein
VRRISASEAARQAAASAEVTRLELLRRKEETAVLRARARRQNAILAIAAGVVLTLTVTAGFVYVSFIPNVERTQSRESSTDRFVATKTGVIRYGEGSRNRCRQVEFKNEGGGFGDDAYVRCSDPTPDSANAPETQQAAATSRFEAIRSTFVKK